MHGDLPELVVTDSFSEEVETIAEWLADAELSRACLVARTHKLAEAYEAALEDRGISTRKVQRSKADDSSKPGLRVATMHRVKGLEYDRMVIAGVSKEDMPLRSHVGRSRDKAVQRETELMERSLLYVAITRARRAALITAHGEASEWLPKVT